MSVRRLYGIALVCAVVSVGAPGAEPAQLATLDADDFELDLNTGVRIYRGNVVFRQGSIRLDCDRLETFFNRDDELDKGVCHGKPGRFQQRLEASGEEVIGLAHTIVLDQIKALITLQDRAEVIRGQDKISGGRITYDLETEKIRVTSGAAADGDESSPAATDGRATERPRLIIQPRTRQPGE